VLKYLTELAAAKEIRQVMNSISSRFGRYKRTENSGIKSSKADEKRSCWAIVSIDGFEIEAKIIHRGMGGFEILDDKYRGKYTGEIVDASDVIRCRVEDDNIIKPKMAVPDPSSCDFTFGNNHRSKCSHQLTSKTYEQINAIEDLKLRVIEEKHKQDIEAIQEEMNQRFNLIKFIIQENYNLPHNRNSRRLLNY